MAWSSRFKESLRAGGEPMFAVDFVSPDLFTTELLDGRSRRYVLHSHQGPSGSEHVSQAIQSISGSGQRVNIRTWKTSIGGLRVALSGVVAAQFVAGTIARGMMAELKVGFEGYEFDDFQTVGLYLFQGLSGSGNSWSMDFDDALSAIQSPSSVSLTSEFFENAGTTTTLTSSWSPGSALSVASVSGMLDKTLESGSRGLLYCQPTDGDPFYVKFTGSTALNINLVDANVIGTTRVNMASGDTVTAIGYVHDRVPEIAHRFLFGGLGGLSHMLSDTHMGIRYGSHCVNSSDFSRWRAKWIDEYTDFKADFITSAPIPNAFRALENVLASFGSWLVMKEGGLAWRFIQQMVTTDVSTSRDVAEYVITDADIISEDSYQLYSRDAPVEYAVVRWPGNVQSLDSVVAGLAEVNSAPAQFRYDHPSREQVFDDDVLTSNKTNAINNMKGRITPWYTRIPDEMSLTLKGWQFAEMVPGDVVSLRSEYIANMINGTTVSPDGGPHKRTHWGTQYLVTGIDVDWSGFSTSVQLSTIPDSPRPIA